MSSKQFYKNLFILSLPIILGNVFAYSINMLDTFMIGPEQETYLIAINIANNYFLIFHYLCLGIGNGLAILFSRMYGKKDKNQISELFTDSLFLIIIISAIFLLVSWFNAEAICSWFSKNPVDIIASVEYLKYMLISGIFLSISVLFLALFRSICHMKIILLSALGGFLTKLILNSFLIAIGAKSLLRGIGYTTIMARFIEMAILIFYFWKSQKDVQICRAKNHEELNDFFKVGIPVVCSDTLLGIGQNMIAILIGAMGSNMIAANSVCSMALQLTSFLLIGLASASVTAIGNLLGAKQIEEAKKAVKRIMYCAICIGAINCLAVIIFRKPFIDYFNLSKESIAYANPMMIITGVGMFFSSVSYVITKTVLRVYKDTKFLFVMDLSVFWLLILPLGYMIGIRWGYSPVLMFLCLKCEDVIKTFIGFIRMEKILR